MVLFDEVVNQARGVASAQYLQYPRGDMKHPQTVAEARVVRSRKCQTRNTQLPYPVQPLKLGGVNQIDDKPVLGTDGNQPMHRIPKNPLPVVLLRGGHL